VFREVGGGAEPPPTGHVSAGTLGRPNQESTPTSAAHASAKAFPKSAIAN